MEKRLYRSRRDRMIAGVCAGVAEYFTADPTLVRIIWVLVTLVSGGLGILAYVAAMIVVPEAPRLPRDDAATTYREDAPSTPPSERAESAGDGGADGAAGNRAAAGGSAEPERTDFRETNPHGRAILGVILVALGAFFLVRNLFPWIPFFESRYVWPSLLILIGIVVLGNSMGRRG